MLATRASPAMMCAVAIYTWDGRPMELSQQNQWKKEAGDAAAMLVEDGMVVGLGTGSTASFAIAAIGRKVAQEGLRILGIPTSDRTAEQARAEKIPLTTFAEHTQIDLTIDGADEVFPGPLYLIKGHGGALLREKIVASASKRMVIIADETKVVDRLGLLVSVPVEVVQYGWQVTQLKLKSLGARPKMRMISEGKPYVTDGGNYIFHCNYGPLNDPKDTAHHLDHVVGAVEHGLFLGFATKVIVGGRDGVKVYEKS
jgi:ribose 5-phosphate isomerase A